MELYTREDVAVAATRVLDGNADEDVRRAFMSYVEKLEVTLNELDEEDAVGTEGWRAYIGIK